MKTIKRISALLLAVLLMAGLSISAWAEEYDISQGSITVTATSDGSSTTQTVTQENVTSGPVEQTTPTVITGTTDSNTLTINTANDNATANVTLGGVTISSSDAAVTTSGAGSVVIELDGTNTVIAGDMHAGVEKHDNGTLTITDKNETAGSLNAQGGDYAAGIGGGQSGNGTDITISDATVTATGGFCGAGIGGGHNGEGTGITISDGATVTANGGENGAGIGGGNLKNGTNITIADATVYATSLNIGAGIGGGGSTETASDVTVSGDAQVHVAGGQEKSLGAYSYGAGAAIGNGGAYSNNPSSPAGDEVDPDISGLTTGSISYYPGGTTVEQMKKGSVKPIKIVPERAPKPAAPTYCKLSFDLGGGTIDGKSTYVRNMLFGQKLELPTPVKDGATFKGWKTTIDGEEVILEAGEQFTVKGAASFVAIWE